MLHTLTHTHRQAALQAGLGTLSGSSAAMEKLVDVLRPPASRRNAHALPEAMQLVATTFPVTQPGPGLTPAQLQALKDAGEVATLLCKLAMVGMPAC